MPGSARSNLTGTGIILGPRQGRSVVPMDDGHGSGSGRRRGDTDTEEQAGDDPAAEGRAKLLGGRISCVVGLLLAAGQVFAALLGGGANTTAAALGVGFCILGYFLDSRKLATATVVLCAAAILFGLAASQGYVS